MTLSTSELELTVRVEPAETHCPFEQLFSCMLSEIDKKEQEIMKNVALVAPQEAQHAAPHAYLK